MRETPKRTLAVSVVLCIVCSAIVASAASLLRERQQRNAWIDYRRNIVVSAGLLPADASSADAERIAELFRRIEPVVIDLVTGRPVPEIDPAGFDQEKADKAPEYLDDLRGDDIAGIHRRARLQTVYLVRKNGQLDQVVLRIYGRGLWSTMYGFLALDKDTNTVRGLNFYEHGETPGLGGEIDNPRWKAKWEGKKAFDAQFKPVLRVVKGAEVAKDPKSVHRVDAISGATITSAGVQNAVTFWLSNRGYGNFLERVRKGDLR